MVFGPLKGSALCPDTVNASINVIVLLLCQYGTCSQTADPSAKGPRAGLKDVAETIWSGQHHTSQPNSEKSGAVRAHCSSMLSTSLDVQQHALQ